jgi:hypothetical protein
MNKCLAPTNLCTYLIRMLSVELLDSSQSGIKLAEFIRSRQKSNFVLSKTIFVFVELLEMSRALGVVLQENIS